MRRKENVCSLDDLHIISGIKYRSDKDIEEGDTVQIRFNNGKFENAIFYFAVEDGCIFNYKGNTVKL